MNAYASRPNRGDRRNERLRGASLVWDNHGCMPLRCDLAFLPELDRYRRSGVKVVSLNVGYGKMTWVEHLEILSFFRQWVAKQADKYRLISTVDDVHRCQEERKLGICFDVEGMYPLQERVSLVQSFYELGVRWMLIAYNRNNAAGGGCLDEDCGLTTVGRAIIDEMERVGMVLCLSHAGRRTVAEAIEYCHNPPIFSHSNPFGDHAHPRNVPDSLILACAKKGGVFGLSGIGSFLGTRTGLVDRLLRQLNYLIDLVGPEHVGLGLDYVFDVTEIEEALLRAPELFAPGTRVGGARATVEPEAVADIMERLAITNLSDAQIKGILGGNWLRIAHRVWR
jgi:membrane dipeptidase